MKTVILLLILISCSLPKKKVTEVSTVSLESNRNDSIVIEKGEDSTALIEEEAKVKYPKISLSIYSSVYHSLAMVEFFKELEKRKIKINTISSQAFGSVIAALYAKEGSVSSVEWSLFKLLKNLKSEVPYSKKWKDKVNKFIDSEFKSTMSHKMKIKLILPLIDENGQVEFIGNGRIETLLKRQINLAEENHFYRRPQNYHYRIEKFGVDLNLGMSFLPERPRISNIVGYNYGVATKHLGVVLSSKEDISIIKTSSSKELDNLLSLSDISMMYGKGIIQYVDEMEVKIKNWQEDSSASFQY